jgi:pimeloyl-ACP methyl ester carboxylesterase
LIVVLSAGVLAAKEATLAVKDAVFVPSGGTQLYVDIRGVRKDAPVVLFLHEGPANVLGLIAFQAYAGVGLEKDFVVAYLHQRGVLRSPDVPDSTQTLARHLQDIDSVIEYLRNRLGARRVHVIGHSWGGVLGYLYLLDHQDKVGKFVSVCGPFNMPATQFASYEVTLQWARDANEQQAVTDLAGIGAPPYADHKQLLTKTLWSAEAFGGLTQNVDADSALSFTGFAEFDPRWSEEQLRINDAMFTETRTINVEQRVASIETPLLLIAGRNDAEVPYFSLKRGFEAWGGKKKLLIFEQSNHLPFVDEADRFVKEVKAFLLE